MCLHKVFATVPKQKTSQQVIHRLRQLSKSHRTASRPQNLAAALDRWGQDEINRHYERLVHGYVARPYAGRLTIFRAKDGKGRDR